MLRYHHPDIVVGFALSFKESAVIADMIKRAEEKGIKTKAIDYKSIVRRGPGEVPIRPIRA